MKEEGKLSVKDLANSLLPTPAKVEMVGEKWCRYFIERFGWSLLSVSSQQACLPYNHADMKMYRDHFRDMIDSGVHKYLVLNFDQVWRCAFSWCGKLQYKPRELVGKIGRKRPVHKTIDKKRHAVRGARRSLTVTGWRQIVLINHLHNGSRVCDSNVSRNGLSKAPCQDPNGTGVFLPVLLPHSGTHVKLVRRQQRTCVLLPSWRKHPHCGRPKVECGTPRPFLHCPQWWILSFHERQHLGGDLWAVLQRGCGDAKKEASGLHNEG